MAASDPLGILHILRAPVGGLFRHVLDLAEGQAARGHRVGILAATGGGTNAEGRLAALAPQLSLGVHRIAMARQPGLSDFLAIRAVRSLAGRIRPDVLHGHGAKGGAYARLAPAGRAIRVYTPHGGSLHYAAGSAAGRLFAAIERGLARRTDLFLFESEFARRAFETKFGPPGSAARVVPNGVSPAEFEPVTPAGDAGDLVAIGELRHLKGVDVLIDAVALLRDRGRIVTATLVGEGPDGDAFRAQVQRLGLGQAIRFAGFQPARHAFGMGRLLVVASRAESLPYIVLEAGAAGVPMLATDVGGISEIFGPDAALLPPGDAPALAAAIDAALDHPETMRRSASLLQERIRRTYAQDPMVEGVLAAYAEAIGAKFRRSH